MNVFETTATIDDASHLTLREPVPLPTPRECRVIVFFDDGTLQGNPPSAWPKDFFESIRTDDPTFSRPDQGELPPIKPLDL